MKLAAYNPSNTSESKVELELLASKGNHTIVKWIRGDKVGEAIYTVDQRDAGSQGLICESVRDIFPNLERADNMTAASVFLESKKPLLTLQEGLDSSTDEGRDTLLQMVT